MSRRSDPPFFEETPIRSQSDREAEHVALEAFNRRLARRGLGNWEEPGSYPNAVSKPLRNGRGCTGLLVGLLGVLVAIAVSLGLFGAVYWQALDQRGPVHVLILGLDERPQEQGPFRSDTMILAGFEPQEPRVVLFSIPRDLWVTVPGIGENRINTANFFGGAPLAKETVAQTFGVPVHYYAKLNFDGFVQVIDALGGIDVEVAETLHDEHYPTLDYGVTTIHIEAGRHHFSGAEALIYARSRYSTSDFDRARRQQEVITAIRRRLLQPGAWLRVPAVVAALSGAIETDMPAGEWPALALIAFRAGEIERAAIGPNEVTPFVTENGGQVLLPRWEMITPLLVRLFES
ncbi:MAG: LCP family protein [Ardenticatenaceae bacterium]|nr:LCP family protein [Ardenticatenaceae bacterium]